MLIPINLTGGDYEHKAEQLTYQKTRNFWPQQQATQKARSPYVLTSFYGLKLFKEQEGSTDRGAIENQGKVYRVLDTTLYQVASDGAHTSLGFISGSNRCIIKALGEQIIIVNGSGSVYTYDGETLSQNTDINLGSPKGVAVLNNQAVYDQGTGQGFDMSDPGEPDSINGLNNAAAESEPDALKIPYAFKETLYLMGEDTIELWWNSGQGNPPVDKIQGAIINIGLDAIHSVADNTDFIFMFGSDKQVHSITGGASAVDTVISTPAMAKKFKDYTVTEDAIGWTMQLEGQWFYVLTFPAQNITWVYPVGGEWFEWGSSFSGRIRANSYIKAFNKDLVMDNTSGNIYELDPETYTDAGEQIIRTRVSAPIHAGLLQKEGKSFEINCLEIMLQKGKGLISGQGSDPRLMLSVSRDGGKTFSTERFLKVGKLGQLVTVTTNSLGRFEHDCVINLSVSDPTYWAIFGAKAEIEVCI